LFLYLLGSGNAPLRCVHLHGTTPAPN